MGIEGIVDLLVAHSCGREIDVAAVWRPIQAILKTDWKV